MSENIFEQSMRQLRDNSAGGNMKSSDYDPAGKVDQILCDSDKGVANGVATLDAGAKVPIAQLPAAVVGAVYYNGTWNASTNTPDLPAAVPTKGDYYVVSVAGTTALGGITDWEIGDWAIYNGAVWEKLDNSAVQVNVANTFIAEQTITIADTSNSEALTINQNDTTNNPDAVLINNTGTGNSLNINSGDLTIDADANITIPNTTFADQSGIIFKGSDRFIHDFNYGNNGTVTTLGGNSFFGKNAGNLTMGSGAVSNYQSSYNTGVGEDSLKSLGVGFYNTSVGYGSGALISGGYSNNAFGYQSLALCVSGSFNLAIGYKSLYNCTGNSNLGIGTSAALNITSGEYNVALGTSSLYNVSATSNNVAIGGNSGRYTSDGSSPATGLANGIYIGHKAMASAVSQTNEIVIGYESIGLGSNSTVLGNSSITKTRIFGNVGLGTDTPNSPLEISTFTVGSSGATAFNRVASLYSNDATYNQEIHLGVLPTTKDTILRFAGGDANGTFGKGYFLKHNKTDNTLEVGINTGGNIDTDSADFAFSSNDLKLKDSGSDTNSSTLSLVANSSSTLQTGTIQCIYGANPYIRFSPPNAAGAATATADLRSDLLSFPSDNTVDIGASGAGRPKDVYIAGTVKAANGELEESETLSGNVTDSYIGSLTLDPGYIVDDAGDYTITRHNYIDVNNPSETETSGTITISDAAVFRFDADAGTHKAIDSGSTKTTPGTVDAWLKVNINGTVYYSPLYTSKTT